MQERRSPLDEASFPAVLAGAQQGAAWAAECLFTDLQPRLLRFLRAAEPRVADDLAGEVWLAMARGIGTFEGDLPACRAWVFAIARRRLADHRRTGARRATDPVDHEFFLDREDANTSRRGDTADLVMNRLSAQAAVDLISANLGPDQAEVLLLRVLGDLDVAHVAEVMGRTPNWVRVAQHRALHRLASVLTRQPEEDVTDVVMLADPAAI
ncbi:MAG: RNA polymerase sigma factor [Actinomycetota bacterium]|nr:RNA polymerase sigma factor [Actinomycetota bacterium]